jgi:hypothetical protein
MRTVGPNPDHCHERNHEQSHAYNHGADRTDKPQTPALNRREFLGGVCSAAALGGLSMGVSARAAQEKRADPAKASSSAGGLPPGKPLRIKPVLTYAIDSPQEKTSWRGYGGLTSRAVVEEEAVRIAGELKQLVQQAEFPVEMLSLSLVETEAQANEAAGTDCDTLLIYAASGGQVGTLAAAKPPKLMFLRHKSGPHYLYYEIAHWRFLRGSGDTIVERNVDIDDIVVDDYAQVLWRLRALYGLKNARGTKMLAIGGLVAYSDPGQQLGPQHAKDVWGYEIQSMTEDEFGQRLKAARADTQIMQAVRRQADELLAQPHVKLETKPEFVVNSFLALHVCKQIMTETGATNFGFGRCMLRQVIEMLDTPPCLVLATANDEGYTAFCHTDLTHTLPGVLLRWIASRPAFLCNSHFPHDGIFTGAHCAAPRRMNGRDFEPARIMTHYESDYGAATKVEYTLGQTVTVVIPNLRCTKWIGFRGQIVACPSHPACRSQLDIKIDGDFRRLAADMQGFHTLVCYGDYLREVGYALKKVGQIEWENISA